MDNDFVLVNYSLIYTPNWIYSVLRATVETSQNPYRFHTDSDSRYDRNRTTLKVIPIIFSRV